MPPIGEDLTTAVNQVVARYNTILHTIVDQHQNATFVDFNASIGR